MLVKSLPCLLVLSAMSIGCGGGKDREAKPPVAESPLVYSGEIPTEEECQEFIDSYLAAIASNDPNAFNAQFDWPGFLANVTRGEFKENLRQAFLNGVNETLSTRLAQKIMETNASDGSIRPLRIHDVEGEKRVLFRLVLPEEGINYHDMVLRKQPDGKVRAVDIHIYLSAELLSQTMRRMYLMGVSVQSPTLFERLSGTESEYIKNIKPMEAMTTRFQAQDFPGVIAAYQELSGGLKQEKAFMIMRLMAAAKVSEEEHVRAIEDYRKMHPRDPSLDLLSIDAFLIKGNYDLALQAIDRLDKSLGGDPYLHVMRANLYLAKKDLPEARRHAELAVSEEPDSIDGYWCLLGITLTQKDFASTKKLLKKVEREFGLGFENLSALPEFAEYVKSPEYQD